MRPKRPRAASTRTTTCSGSRTSVGTARHWAPRASTAVDVSASGSGRRPQTTTEAPPRASSSAVARPIPVPPPVTRAITGCSPRRRAPAPPGHRVRRAPHA
jgi:hypothetical protein